jgi:DNA-binding response OmpR family regulator
MLIMTIDDDVRMRQLLSRALVSEGYDVVAAEHGAAALDLIAQTPPDLILLDLDMPVMDGRAFGMAYQRAPGHHAPIIVLSASPTANEAAEQIAAAGVLPKPFDLDELLATVNACGHRQERGPPILAAALGATVDHCVLGRNGCSIWRPSR